MHSAHCYSAVVQVGRVKSELGDAPPLSRMAEQERAAIEKRRAARLAEIVTSSCKRAVQHITAHKVCRSFLAFSDSWGPKKGRNG